MAASNRDTLSAALAALVPTIDWGTGNDLQAFIDTILDSAVLNRDVVDTVTANDEVTIFDCDFTGVDKITVTVSAGVYSPLISISGISDGDEKILIFNFTEDGVVPQWQSGITDESMQSLDANVLSQVIYKVYKKDSGNIHVFPITKIADITELTDGTWTELTLSGNWGAEGSRTGLWYRKNKIGQLEISMQIVHDLTTYTNTIGTLPAGFRPDYEYKKHCLARSGTTYKAFELDITTGGVISITASTTEGGGNVVGYSIREILIVPLT